MGLPPQLFLGNESPVEDALLRDAPQQQPQMPQSPDMGGPIGASLQGQQQPDLQQPGGMKSTLKRMLSNFMIGGVPALAYGGDIQGEARQRAQMQLQSQAIQNQHIQALTNATNTQTQLANSMVTLPNGITMPYGAAVKAFPQIFAAQSRENVANINANSRENIARMNQGQGVPVDETVANLVGMPEIAGQPAGKALWGNINSALRAQGYKYQDLGQDGLWLVDRAGNKIKKMGESPSVARGESFARNRAEWTPFQTTDEAGNQVTISNAQAIRTGAPSLSTWNSVYGPTGSTKSQGQAAGAVADHIPAFRQSVQNLAAKGELGPVMGRINTFLTEGYGGDDPDISEFVTTIGLLNSGAVRAHFGARGGAQILDKFNRILNTAQTPEAILGSLNGLENFLNTYKDVGVAKPPRTGVPSKVKAAVQAQEPTRPDNVPAGYVYNANGPQGAGWYRPKGK